MKLYIRNMACQSCKILVSEELKKLKLAPSKVELGEAEIKGNISKEKKEKFNSAIKRAGLEIIEDKEGILLEKIKKGIFAFVEDKSGDLHRKNLSGYLSQKLNHNYKQLSTFFHQWKQRQLNNT